MLDNKGLHQRPSSGAPTPASTGGARTTDTWNGKIKYPQSPTGSSDGKPCSLGLGVFASLCFFALVLFVHESLAIGNLEQRIHVLEQHVLLLRSKLQLDKATTATAQGMDPILGQTVNQVTPSLPKSQLQPSRSVAVVPAVAGNFLTEYLKKIPGGKIGDFDYGAHPKAGFKNGDAIPHNVISPPIDAQGKFVIAPKLTRIKIDIGLSWNAPNSDEWLTKFPNMFVIGVEPSIYNIMSIFRLYYDKWKWKSPPSERRFYVIPTAVDDGERRMATFYQGPGDGGTSSLNEFKSGSPRFTKKVPTIHLKDILDAIPEDRFPYIEHIKTDTQGNDVKVLKSAGDSLKKRVVYYSAEPGEYEKNQYKTSHNGDMLKEFMKESGFELIKQDSHAQWTFLNSRFKNHPKLSEMDYSCG